MIGITYTAGKTLYVILQRRSDDQVWNGIGFEVFNISNWSDYAIALNFTAPNTYSISNPTSEDLVDLRVFYYEQVGPSPESDDILIPLAIFKNMQKSNRHGH